MSNYSSGPNKDCRDEDDYGDEYAWWDEYEDNLEEKRFCKN